MFDQLKGLGELLALAQDDEKRTAIIAQVTAPIHQLAAATAELARQQQALAQRMQQVDAAMGILLAAASLDRPELFTADERAHYARVMAQINDTTQEAPPHGN